MYGKFFAAVVAMSCLLVGIGFVIVQISENQQYNIMAWSTTGVIIAITIQNVWGDWLPFRRPKMFMSYSGIPGRKAGDLEQLPAGRAQMLVAFNRTSLPKSLRREVFGDYYMLQGIMTGTVHVYVKGLRSEFTEIDPQDCENPDGVIFFKGRIDGGSLRNPKLLESKAEMERMQDIISYYYSTLKKTKHQIYNLLNKEITDVRQFSSELKVIGDNVNKTIVVAKGGGAAAEAAAMS